MSLARKIEAACTAVNAASVLKTVIILIAFFFAAIVVSRVIYPFDTGHQEALSWMPAGHLLEGKNPYAFATVPPYSMVPYGIVYYGLLAIGGEIFGFNLWWGRSLSALAFVVCVWAVYRIAGGITGNRQAARAAVLVSLALLPAQAWTGIMRSDLIAVAFGLVAVSLVFAEEGDKRAAPRRTIVIAFLCICAFFTKHTVVLPVAIIAFRYLQLRRWVEFAVFSGAVAFGVGAGMYTLNDTSGGGYVWQHFIHAQGLPFEFEKSLGSVGGLLSTPTMAVFVVFLFFVFRQRRDVPLKLGAPSSGFLRSSEFLVFLYCLLSFTAATVSSGRAGANVNYYLESSFVIAVAAGLIYGVFVRNGSLKLQLAMIVLFLGGGVFQLTRVARGEYFRWQARAYYQEISDTAANFVRDGDVCFSIYVELVARTGCGYYFDDYGEYTSNWSPQLRSIFEGEVRAGRFAVIVWNDEGLEQEFPNYRLTRMSRPTPERFFPVYLYVRKGE